MEVCAAASPLIVEEDVSDKTTSTVYTVETAQQENKKHQTTALEYSDRKLNQTEHAGTTMMMHVVAEIDVWNGRR